MSNVVYMHAWLQVLDVWDFFGAGHTGSLGPAAAGSRQANGQRCPCNAGTQTPWADPKSRSPSGLDKLNYRIIGTFN